MKEFLMGIVFAATVHFIAKQHKDCDDFVTNGCMTCLYVILVAVVTAIIETLLS